MVASDRPFTAGSSTAGLQRLRQQVIMTMPDESCQTRRPLRPYVTCGNRYSGTV